MNNKCDLKETFKFRLTDGELKMLNKLSDELNMPKSVILRGLIRSEYLKNIGQK